MERLGTEQRAAAEAARGAPGWEAWDQAARSVSDAIIECSMKELERLGYFSQWRLAEKVGALIWLACGQCGRRLSRGYPRPRCWVDEWGGLHAMEPNLFWDNRRSDTATRYSADGKTISITIRLGSTPSPGEGHTSIGRPPVPPGRSPKMTVVSEFGGGGASKDRFRCACGFERDATWAKQAQAYKRAVSAGRKVLVLGQDF
jgi:hypothetical protein